MGKLLLLILGFCFFYSLHSAELFDHIMDGTKRKKTGIYKLTDKEKQRLQKWIDTHYEKRKKPILQDESDKHPLLEENLLSGQFIRLTDQTVWKISPKDIPICQGWITPVEIIVTLNDEENGEEYPHELTNSLTGSTLRAGRSQVP